MHVPFQYFYPPNGSKAHHFPPLPGSSQMCTNESKATARHNTPSPENSSSPINFSSRLENNTFCNLRQSMEDFQAKHGPRLPANEDKQPDDENVEVD